MNRLVQVYSFITIAIIFLATSTFAAGQDGNAVSSERSSAPRIIPRLTQSIVLDGSLDEAAWSEALAMEIAYEVAPSLNTEARVRTQVLIAYDQDNFYVGFKCWDPNPDDIRTYHSRRDDFQGDWVAVNLDTFNDQRRCISLAINSLGTQWDAIRSEQGVLLGWDTLWDSATAFYDWGWEGEIVIPFSSISFQRTEGTQIWGFDAWRRYPRSVSHWFALIPFDHARDYFAQLVQIEGFEGINPGRNVEIAPTFVAARSDSRGEMPDGEMEPLSREEELGLTASWGVTPNMTLQGTMNPDFSQVEADALKLDINEPFALFYEEKRPFFTESEDFFQTDLNAVYTRSIRDPSWGIKLAGKEGPNTVGAYVMRDEVTNLIIPGKLESSAVSLNQPNYTTIIRYRRDIGSRYAVGMIATDREGDDYYNRLLGIDGDFFVTNSDRVRVQYLGSATKYPQHIAEQFGMDEEGEKDSAYSLSYIHETSSQYWAMYYHDVGNAFRTDVGFNTRADYRQLIGEWANYWRAAPGRWWSRMDIGAGIDYTRDHDGNQLGFGGNAWARYRGPMQSTILLDMMTNRETVISGEEFDVDFGRFGFSIHPTGSLTIRTTTEFGSGIDYANSRPARRFRFNPDVFMNVGRNLTFELNHVFERLTVAEGRLYTANISDASVYYHFNRRSYVRAILQYVDYDRAAGLYTFDIDPQYRRLFTQFLFSYEINPRTVLYMGYSDRYLGNSIYSLTQSDRMFFVKLGYAWVL